MVDEFRDWLDSLDHAARIGVLAAVVVLGDEGPTLGRPLVDSVKGSRFRNMKELRPPAPGRLTIRVLFAFDPVRQAVLLVGGDKANDWEGWYRRAIPLADSRFERYLLDMDAKEGR